MIHMKVKKSLLPRHFPVITNNGQGAMQEDYPFVPRDCYYYSYLEGVPGSVGTLDTCSGSLHGMLQMDDFTYEIKPLKASSKFEHVVSLLVSEERSAELGKCEIEEEGTNEAYAEEILAETPRAGPVYLWWPHKKYLKIHCTVANSLVVHNTNHTSIIENIVILNNIMHTIYKQCHLDINICVVCIWDAMDPFNIYLYADVQKTLTDFGLWKYYGFWEQIP